MAPRRSRRGGRGRGDPSPHCFGPATAAHGASKRRGDAPMVPNDHISEGGGRGIKGEAVIPPRDHRAKPPPRTRVGTPVAADGEGGGGVFGARAHLVPPRAGSAPSRRRRGRRRPGGGPFFHFSRLDSRQRKQTGNVSNEVARLPGVLYTVGESTGSPRSYFVVGSAQKISPRAPRGQRLPRHLDEPRAAP